MENQHRKITGYRELNQEEIDLMNEIKALGPKIEEILIKVQNTVDEQRNESIVKPAEHERMENATPERFLALAKTDFQTALMYTTRAVAQPEFF